ncbi:hypothetical protein [Occallatibacter savannae]|uniref:hypothetical protein n=1 Tax=Occallatibacter savannae TaxID=1002691 RepID=UPI000D68A40C|nr:hypothetical protein [Occallatibacter savannae]
MRTSTHPIHRASSSVNLVAIPEPIDRTAWLNRTTTNVRPVVQKWEIGVRNVQVLAWEIRLNPETTKSSGVDEHLGRSVARLGIFIGHIAMKVEPIPA